MFILEEEKDQAFTVSSRGVGSHDALSKLLGPAVIPPEWNMEADKRDRDKRLKPNNHLTIYDDQAPVTSRIRGICEQLSRPVSVQAINSTLLNTRLISLTSNSSKLPDKKRSDSKTKIKR